MSDETPSTLGRYIRVKHGFAFKGEYFTEKMTSDVLVTPGNFALGGGFQDDKKKYYDGPVPDGYVLQPGDLVVTMTDLSKAGDTLGYPALIPESVGTRYLHNQRIGLIEIKDGVEVDKGFLFYRLRADDYRRHILATASGSTVRHTSPGRIYEFEPALPSIDDQRAIAGVLGALDGKIMQNRRATRVLERLAQAIFRAWFVDFDAIKAKASGSISFPSMPQSVFDRLPSCLVDSGIGPIPEGWEMKPIGDVVSIKGGATPSTKNSEYWEEGTHCWATPRDLSRLSSPVLLDTERRITDAGVQCISSGLLPPGSVLMSSRAPVGYLAIAGVPTAINQGFIAMVCDGPLPPTYIWQWAYASMDAIHARASGTTFPEISKKNFRPLPVVVPPPDVVAAFQSLVDPLLELLTATIKEDGVLASMRDYLLPRLLSRSVRVERANG
ncbi:restriction endonuclease subunit S [Paraburkholderia sediminicola]|uniref:restriction endonuclease subunit S n=1 Tax=Paraburkholderia sediminicola TaxID=458836 RepID=UPI0038B6E6F4